MICSVIGTNSGQFSKSSSGCTTISSGSNEIAAISQMSQNQNHYTDNDNMHKIRFDKVMLIKHHFHKDGQRRSQCIFLKENSTR